MTGLGTIINSSAIIVGGVAGLLFGKALKPRFRDSMTFVMGLSTIFIGAGGVLSGMLRLEDGKFSTGGSLLLIFSLVLGCLLGELADIDRGCERLGEWLKKRSKSSDSRFVNAFVTSSMTVCIGAMAVIGSINDGINGDISILLTKSLLDLIIIVIMTASMGIGCIFSALPVFVFQGSITLLSKLLEPLMTDQATWALSLVGSALIFCVGINLAFDRKIKVGNLLPSLIFAVAFSFVPSLV